MYVHSVTGQSVSPPAPTFTVASSLQRPSPASRPTLLLLCCCSRAADSRGSVGRRFSFNKSPLFLGDSEPRDGPDRDTLTPSVYSFTRLTPLPAVSCSRAGGRRLFSFFFFSLSLSISPCPSLWTLPKKVQVRTSIYHVELVLVSRSVGPPAVSPSRSNIHSGRRSEVCCVRAADRGSLFLSRVGKLQQPRDISILVGG